MISLLMSLVFPMGKYFLRNSICYRAHEVMESGVKEWNQCLALSLREKRKRQIFRVSSMNLVNLMVEQIARNSLRKL